MGCAACRVGPAHRVRRVFFVFSARVCGGGRSPSVCRVSGRARRARAGGRGAARGAAGSGRRASDGRDTRYRSDTTVASTVVYTRRPERGAGSARCGPRAAAPSVSLSRSGPRGPLAAVAGRADVRGLGVSHRAQLGGGRSRLPPLPPRVARLRVARPRGRPRCGGARAGPWFGRIPAVRAVHRCAPVRYTVNPAGAYRPHRLASSRA